MSTGISISCVNRIKELAEEKKYAEALVILDTQNLDKSINPQFLRISGEIFRENKRYYDSRKVLLRAHQMSPQGIRIIYELIQVYLELGYFTKAKQYYDQYVFYSPPEDTQKDYVKYIMEKASGAEIKELAVILIPILERMPEARWNFEAVLLYDKLGRKDKALDESRYILEHFKDSAYVHPVMEYIDDKLDVDQYFYTFPREEQEEDVDLFGELISLEEEILKADYLRMYPPEARIMVEVDDNDIPDIKPPKEKKKKRKKKADKNNEIDEYNKTDTEDKEPVEAANVTDELEEDKAAEEERIRKEREAALERLLSKKLDKEKIKESARQLAQAIKDIDTEKTKKQVRSVTETVKENVKKATDVLGEAVGTKLAQEEFFQSPEMEDSVFDEEYIVDGIIEEELSSPKQVVGEVVTNEELDSLILDSLEAMSEDEIAERKAERIENDIQEERSENISPDEKGLEPNSDGVSTGIGNAEGSLNGESFDTEKENEMVSNEDQENTDTQIPLDSIKDIESVTDSTAQQDYTGLGSYEELKDDFFRRQSMQEEKPLDSLGFISIVHADVDSRMEQEVPEVANLLRQMIGNKEFYTGEDSTLFEAESSYDDHGFEIMDYDFDDYMKQEVIDAFRNEQTVDSTIKMPDVEMIYTEGTIDYFDEMIPEDANSPEGAPIEETSIPTALEMDGCGEQMPEYLHESSASEYDQFDRKDMTGKPEDSLMDGSLKKELNKNTEEDYNSDRYKVRTGILLTDSMVNKLMILKESR